MSASNSVYIRYFHFIILQREFITAIERWIENLFLIRFKKSKNNDKKIHNVFNICFTDQLIIRMNTFWLASFITYLFLIEQKYSQLRERNWRIYPPLDFFSFNYFFVGTDLRIQDHKIRTWTFLVLGKKSIL